MRAVPHFSSCRVLAIVSCLCFLLIQSRFGSQEGCWCTCDRDRWLHGCWFRGGVGLFHVEEKGRKRIGSMRGETHKSDICVKQSKFFLFFDPTCTSLCTQTLNCLYIVSLHQMCVCDSVYSNFAVFSLNKYVRKDCGGGSCWHCLPQL